MQSPLGRSLRPLPQLPGRLPTARSPSQPRPSPRQAVEPGCQNRKFTHFRFRLAFMVPQRSGDDMTKLGGTPGRRSMDASSYYVLLDYYNIPSIHRQRGAKRIVQRILDTLGAKILADSKLSVLRIRFYGGWYGKASLSKHGQKLVAELNEIPTHWGVGTHREILRLRIQAELAGSMLVDPAHHILHTLRRGTPPIHEVRPLPFRGCIEPTACSLAPVEALVVQRNCPAGSCSTPISAVFPRPKQQKLVDTMIVSDLIYLACTTRRPVVVVSTDDDLWPGIRTALHFGLPIHHIHTGNRTTPAIYASTAFETPYREYRFR